MTPIFQWIDEGMDPVLSLLARLRADPEVMRCVTAWERLPARAARTAPWPAALDPRLVAAARAAGVEAPYTHQAEAIAAALEGHNVVLATAAASGKSLAVHLPVLQTLLTDPTATALYLFPTKALAHDQLAALQPLLASLPPIVAAPYDGDTPTAQRAAVRQKARLLVTNPDMLHLGILPYHTRWARFLSGLRWVVLDELHVYHGVFGSHVANVLRRLRRVCRFYGADPRFLCASATLANPRDLAEQLIEAEVYEVQEDGAPRGEKHVLLYNPPLLDPALGLRRPLLLAALDIADRILRADLQTIFFARSRLSTEILLGYLRERAPAWGQDPAAIRGYRGGYLPLQRREIERGLREGTVRAVVATNALELGVDIGQMAACVLVGYPGSVASTWQQAGRAGRRAGASLVVLIASSSPLDQYLATHPEFLFGRPVEEAHLNPDNPAILADHVACAAYELPFERGESFGDLPDVEEWLRLLEETGDLYRSDGRYTWVGEGEPARAVNLRTGTPDVVVIQDVGADPPQVVGEIDRPSAPMLVYPGAIYLHEADMYRVEDLDWEGGLARVRAVEVDYYTRASATTEVRVMEILEHAGPPSRAGSAGRPAGTDWEVSWGTVEVTTRVTGYRQVRRYTHEVLGWGEVDLPEQRMETVGVWIDLGPELVERLQEERVLRLPTDYGPDWPAQRAAALARDGYRCRHCGAPEREGHPLEVHHLVPFALFGYIPGVNDFYRLANRLENLITLCGACHRRAERARGARSALSGLAYLLRGLAPLYVLCAPGDLETAVEPRALQTGLPRVTVYDRVPGGAGLSARLYELLTEGTVLLEAARERVTTCPCADGCPACVGPVGEQEEGTKERTQRLLEEMLLLL
ncbi:MAG: DEAD/DEAH box helicase [Thermoflexales bacterium]|nr:DEAD/DEAH box helicase [Thermoflexales bacterium]